MNIVFPTDLHDAGTCVPADGSAYLSLKLGNATSESFNSTNTTTIETAAQTTGNNDDL